MKKVFSILLFISAMLLSAQKPEQILDQHFRSLGKNLDQVQSILQKGKMSMNGIDFPMENYQDTHGKIYSKINMMGNDITVMAFDGKKGYMFDNMSYSYIDIPDSLAQKFQTQAQHIFGEFYHYDKDKLQLKYLGLQKIDGQSYQVVQIHYKKPIETDIQDIILYFNPENHLLTFTRATTQGKIVEVKMDKYQNFDGYLFATQVSTKIDGQIITSINFDQIKINPPEPDPAIFIKPKH